LGARPPPPLLPFPQGSRKRPRNTCWALLFPTPPPPPRGSTAMSTLTLFPSASGLHKLRDRFHCVLRGLSLYVHRGNPRNIFPFFLPSRAEGLEYTEVPVSVLRVLPASDFPEKKRSIFLPFSPFLIDFFSEPGGVYPFPFPPTGNRKPFLFLRETISKGRLRTGWTNL